MKRVLCILLAVGSVPVSVRAETVVAELPVCPEPAPCIPEVEVPEPVPPEWMELSEYELADKPMALASGEVYTQLEDAALYLREQMKARVPVVSVTMKNYEQQAKAYLEKQPIRESVILGGEKLIPDLSAKRIFGLSVQIRMP